MTSLKTRLPRRGRLVALVGAALLTAACGTAAGTTPVDAPATSSATEASNPPATQAQVEQSTTDSTQATAAPTSSIAAAEQSEAEPPVQAVGPAIPGMTLALDDGSSIDLASAERPVMLVFWAEW